MHEEAKEQRQQMLNRKGPREGGLVAVKQPLTVGPRAGSTRTFYINPRKRGLSNPDLTPQHIGQIESSNELQQMIPQLSQVNNPYELIAGELFRLSKLPEAQKLDWGLLVTLTQTHGNLFTQIANLVTQHNDIEGLLTQPDSRTIQRHHDSVNNMKQTAKNVKDYLTGVEINLIQLANVLLNDLRATNQLDGKPYDKLLIKPIGSHKDPTFVHNWYTLQHDGVTALLGLINEPRMQKLPSIIYVTQNTLPDNKLMLYEAHIQTCYITDDIPEITIQCLFDLYGQHLLHIDANVQRIIRDYFTQRTKTAIVRSLPTAPGYTYAPSELSYKGSWSRPYMGLIDQEEHPIALLSTTLQSFTTPSRLANLLRSDFPLGILVYGLLRGH